ncbi:diacylglycerol kinase family protein [uncultured Brevundimonas sp.]|uniref:diacylglycerol/lipid kinase family protein n=1 Tax=uncultured Brevundimonas sp. TaxID=213418 RepID=UPI0026062BB5|nr:diacylglycerol kinase family protein [uncultured Brevundimonas sp.]
MSDTNAPEQTSPEGPKAVTQAVKLDKIIMLINPMSGGVGNRAADDARAILDEYDVEADVRVLEGEGFARTIDDAIAERPDALLVLAGDGTARSVATLAGQKDILVATLPGGTMNMLPKALYGTGDWKKALRRTLEEGEPRKVAGGALGDEHFYCAAIMGAPALWAPAREAIRSGKIGKAISQARLAFRRAFSGRIRFDLGKGVEEKAEALVLITPLISKAFDENDPGLEAAIMKTSDTGQALRLAANAVFTDWRNDAAVETHRTRKVRIWGRSRIPAVIDGETVPVGKEGEVRFVEHAFTALALSAEALEDAD